MAVVYPAPFRVVLHHPDGRLHEGPVIAYEPVRLSEGHREAWRRNEERPVLMSVLARGEDRSRHIYLPRRFPEPSRWPTTLPPFVARGVRFAPDGMLWIERSVEADAEPVFDLVDTAGRVVRRVQLPIGRHLVGLGDGTLYAAYRDPWELEYIERYRLR